MTVCFVELKAFTDEVLRVANEEPLRQFETERAARPEAGDLIRQSGPLSVKSGQPHCHFFALKCGCPLSFVVMGQRHGASVAALDSTLRGLLPESCLRCNGTVEGTSHRDRHRDQRAFCG